MTERLARVRVPLGFVAALIVLWLAHPTPATVILGAIVALCGESLRTWAAGHLNKSREVISSGPYRWFAHPLYVGSSVMGAGLAIASNRLVVAVVIAAYLGATMTTAIGSEEAFLRGKFGGDYDRYRRGRGGDESRASRRRFSIALAIANREHRAMVGLLLAVLLLLLKATYNGAFWRAAVGR